MRQLEDAPAQVDLLLYSPNHLTHPRQTDVRTMIEDAVVVIDELTTGRGVGAIELIGSLCHTGQPH